MFVCLSDFDARAKSAPAFSTQLTFPSLPTGLTGSPGEEDLDIFSSLNPEVESYRRNPEYKAYYHANRALNPRLPPPLPPHVSKAGFELEHAPGSGACVLCACVCVCLYVCALLHLYGMLLYAGDAGGKSLIDRLHADFPAVFHAVRASIMLCVTV